MRILQVHNSYRERGGEDISVAAEAELLRAAGHEVRQYIVANPERSVATIRTLARASHNRGAACSVVQAAHEFRPDVAHVNNTWFALSAAVVEALADADVPTVMTLRNYRIACMQGLLFRDGGVCTDCIGRSPLPGMRHRCYRNSFLLSSLSAAAIGVARRRGSWEQASRFIALSASAKRSARRCRRRCPRHRCRAEHRGRPR